MAYQKTGQRGSRFLSFLDSGFPDQSLDKYLIAVSTTGSCSVVINKRQTQNVIKKWLKQKGGFVFSTISGRYLLASTRSINHNCYV